jgi:hypothetical protein
VRPAGIAEAKTWEAERPDELGAGIAVRDRHRLWRCASGDDPYFGRGSHWTPHRSYAEWLADHEASAYPKVPRRELFRADVLIPDAALLDLRHHVEGRVRLNRPLPVYGRSDAVLTAARHLARRGVEWVFLSGDLPLADGEPEWTEAIYVGTGSVEAAPAELDPLP